MDTTHAHHKVEMGSERNFGLIVGGILGLIGLWPLLSGEAVRLVFVIPAGLLIAAATVYPPVLKPLNKAWYWLGMALGAIVAPVVMALVFFLVVTPIALIMKALRADLLDTAKKQNVRTFWIERDEPVGSMKNQF